MTYGTVLSSLYFGRGTLGRNATVAPGDWRRFLLNVVIPRFPNGTTNFPADGTWMEADGTLVFEETYVLQIVHTESLAEDALIQQIVDQYKAAFSQESVMRVKQVVSVSF